MVLPIIAHTEQYGRLASAGLLDEGSLSVLDQASLEASFGGSFTDADFVNISDQINRAGAGLRGATSLEGTFGPDICDDDTMSVHR